MVDPTKKNPYTDTPAPRSFQAASPFDPQLFSRMTDFAGELLKGERGGKYSPVEVAQWLEDLAGAAAKAPIEAKTPEMRRIAIDIDIEAGLGRFFGGQVPCRGAVCDARADRRSRGTRRGIEAVPEGTRDLGRNRRASQGGLRGRTLRWASIPGCAGIGSTACPPSTRTSPIWPSGWRAQRQRPSTDARGDCGSDRQAQSRGRSHSGIRGRHRFRRGRRWRSRSPPIAGIRCGCTTGM